MGAGGETNLELGLEGKVALITGGSRLIGFEIARRLGLEGARVAISARNKERLEAAAQRLRGEGISAFAYPADVNRETEVQALVSAVASEYGAIDILVNNPGGIVASGSFSQVSLDEWRLGLEINLISVLSVTSKVLPHLKAQPWGRIINIGAFYTAPLVPGIFKELAENAVAKTALAASTKVMAEELAPNITVNCVAPGPVGKDHKMREMTRSFPVPGPADPLELADLVAFLCSRQAGYLTGLTIPFDGGATRRIL